MTSTNGNLNFVKEYISANLNSTMLFVFLMGFYTMVYLGTMCLYVTRAHSRKIAMIVVLSVLYGLTFASLVFQWYFLSWILVNKGDTEESEYLAGTTLMPPIDCLIGVFQYCAYLIADGLLVWRCIQMYEGYARAVILPVFLFFLEIVLCIVSTVLTVKTDFGNHAEIAERGREFNIIDGIFSFIVAATSAVSTFLICRRIVAATSQQSKAKNKYAHVIRLLVESSMLYSLTVIVFAISGYFDIGTTTGTAFVASNYLEAIVVIVSGLSPTIMVAGISLSKDKDHCCSEAMSGVEFATNTSSGTSEKETTSLSDSSLSISIPSTTIQQEV